MSRRVYWIDALRVLAVLLLVPFHSARVFDIWSPFYAKNAQISVGLSWFVAAVSLWHMPVLFALAGASTYFALSKRTSRQYVGERAVRLLVPFVFGVAVLIPPQCWYGARTNVQGYSQSFLSYWPEFFRFDVSISDYFGGFGFGHLWFIVFLFVIASVTLPLLRWFGCERGRRCTAWFGAHPLVTLVGFGMLATMVADALPEVATHELFAYVVFFVLGFLLIAEDRLGEWAEARRWWLLAASIATLIPTAITFQVAEDLPDLAPLAISNDLTRLATTLLSVLALTGLARAYLDRPYRGLGYASEASYPFYIWHQTVIVVAAFYIAKLPLAVAPKWLLVMAVGFIGSWGLYELLVRRVAPARFLFGMKRQTAR